MFDPAILLNLEAPMPPQMPVMVIEQTWRSADGDRVEWVGRRYADAFDVTANAWADKLNKLRQVRLTLPAPDATLQDQIPHLTKLIENYEAVAEMRARYMASAQKDIRRQVKAAFRRDPAVAAAIRETGERMIATDKRLQEELLDYALFLRAIRSDCDPESRGGPTFDNAEDLSSYLDSLVAA